MLILGASLTYASDQKKVTNTGKSASRPKLTKEETEIIRNRELLENLELLEDFESVQHLRLLAQDSAAKKKTQPAERKGVGENAKKENP